MKLPMIVLSAAFAFAAFANESDWNVVAETLPGACEEKMQILAKPGEKYVMIVKGETKEKLFSKDKSAFNRDDSVEVQFESALAAEKSLKPSFVFTKPSYVNGSPAKIEITNNGSKQMCKMALK